MALFEPLVEAGVEYLFGEEEAANVLSNLRNAKKIYDTVKHTPGKRDRQGNNIITPEKGGHGTQNGQPPGAPHSNNPSTTTMSRNPTEATNEEVPLVPLPKRLALSVPDYFSIVLPYSETYTAAMARGLLVNTPTSLATFRLNSIYDPVEANSFGSTGGPSPSSHQPMGRDAWAAIYKYYRVTKCEVEIMLINRTCFTYADAESVEDIIAGIEWTDDNSSTGTAQTLTAFMESKTSQVKPVFARSRNGPYTAGLAMTGIGGPAVFTFEYTPESWHFHVNNTSNDEFWTPIASTPTLAHRLCLSFFPWIPGINTARTYDIQALVNLKYTVQFREPIYGVVKTQS